MQTQMMWKVEQTTKAWFKFEDWVPMVTSIGSDCCLEIPEITKPRVSGTLCLYVWRSDPHFMLRYSW